MQIEGSSDRPEARLRHVHSSFLMFSLRFDVLRSLLLSMSTASFSLSRPERSQAGEAHQNV